MHGKWQILAFAVNLFSCHDLPCFFTSFFTEQLKLTRNDKLNLTSTYENDIKHSAIPKSSGTSSQTLQFCAEIHEFYLLG